jgi:hypothetical protein
MEPEKKRSGRPKKAEEDKVKYQRIAVYLEDYEKLAVYLERNDIKITQAFKDMVKSYTRR